MKSTPGGMSGVEKRYSPWISQSEINFSHLKCFIIIINSRSDKTECKKIDKVLLLLSY